MIQRILVPVDFSDVTENALLTATEIARKTKAVVELFHLIEAPFEYEIRTTGETIIPEGLDNVFILKSIELAKKKMQEILDDSRYVGVRFIPRIKIGKPYSSIANDINKEDSELIIMGCEGSSSILDSIFNGTNSDKVARKANSMVLTVKKGTNDFNIRNVIFATNLKDDSSKFIEKLKQLQEIFDFNIHVLYVNPLIGYEHEVAILSDRLNEFAITYNLKNYSLCIREDITEYAGITGYADEINADIIALSIHSKGFNILGGIADDLVNSAERPVLTFNPSN